MLKRRHIRKIYETNFFYNEVVAGKINVEETILLFKKHKEIRLETDRGKASRGYLSAMRENGV